MKINNEITFLRRALRSMIVVLSQAVLAPLSGVGLIVSGKSPEAAILISATLSLPSLALVSWYLAYGFKKD